MVAMVADDDEEFSEVTLTDRYAQAFESPRLDDRQDLTLISGGQYSGITNVLFYRDAVTGDGFDRAIRKGEQQELCLATGADDNFAYHSLRTSRLVDLYGGVAYGSSKDGWDGDRVGHYRSPGEHFEIEWGFAGSGDSEGDSLFFPSPYLSLSRTRFLSPMQTVQHWMHIATLVLFFFPVVASLSVVPLSSDRP